MMYYNLKSNTCSLIDGDGGNELVETNRGKGFFNPDLTTEALNDINIGDYL